MWFNMKTDLGARMLNNPFAGPAHVVALANALEQDRRPGAYIRPPSTGGEQVSVRLNDTLVTHLELLSKAAGWTRVQVMTALIERGLFDLYDLLSNEAGEAVMQNLADELVPVMHSESKLLIAAKQIAREVAGSGATVAPAHRPERFWVEGARLGKGIPRMLVIIERSAAQDFEREATEGQGLKTLRSVLAMRWAEALAQPGTEIRCQVSPETLLP